jgi:hypothetical protein
MTIAVEQEGTRGSVVADIGIVPWRKPRSNDFLACAMSAILIEYEARRHDSTAE